MENETKENKNNGIFIGIILLVGAIIVLFFPKIYTLIQKKPTLPNEENNTNKEVKKEVTEEVLSNLHRPLMRNSVYSKDSYYTLDSFGISNMSNNDILYNAFLDIYEGNMVDSYKGGNCSGTRKEFNSEYMTLRIKNIIGKKTNYSFGTFYVPEDSSSNFKGEWYYDASSDKFIYNGLCSSKATGTKYYNLEQMIKAEYSGSDVIVYYYVGFAKVEGSNYTIYSDASFKNELTKGVGSIDTLEDIFKSIDKSNKKTYKYTFKNSLCSYNEYCLYKGEYVDGI